MDGQSVHVGPQQNDGAFTALQGAHDTGDAHPGRDGEACLSQVAGRDAGRADLFEPEFGMSVEVSVDAGDVDLGGHQASVTRATSDVAVLRTLVTEHGAGQRTERRPHTVGSQVLRVQIDKPDP